MHPNQRLAMLALAALLMVVGCQPADRGSRARGDAAVDTAAVMAAIDSLRESFEQAVAESD